MSFNIAPGANRDFLNEVFPHCRHCGTVGDHYCPNDVDTHDTDPTENESESDDE